MMLSTRLNVALSATGTATKSSFRFGKWSLTRFSNKIQFHNKRTCVFNYCPILDQKPGESWRKNVSLISSARARTISSRSSASVDLKEKADIFGDLGDQKFERTELDEAELKEEEFLMNEARPSRRSVPSEGKYADMIKKHIKSGDLKAGLEVLDQIKEDRTQPNSYMYNLLIRAFAQRGDLKKCFSLYNRMKKQELKPSSGTYVSLVNACANYPGSKMALEKLVYVRQTLIEKNIVLNAVHYNAMIKAYGRHGKLLEAFQLVDEMMDKKITIGISTLNFLLQGAISDKEAGFRHALVVWQVLKSRKLRPDIFTFNLLLRSARDCKLGDIRIEDLLVAQIPAKTPGLNASSDRTNLLAYPPIVSPLMPLIGEHRNSDNNPEALANRHHELEQEPVAPIVTLDSSYAQTNLLLMGGFSNFVDQMKSDNVRPDIKSVTYLMELAPPTVSAEAAVISYARSMGVKLDIDFYNLLIKKRSFRFDYNNAVKVLQMMQQDHLEPNIMTWGVLALTCRDSKQAKEIFEGMALSGHMMNVQIVGAILRQATNRWLFGLVLELMEKMRVEGPRPNDKIFELLETFRKKAIQVSKDADSPDFVRKPFWQNGYRKFNLRYPTWMTEMKVDPPENRKKK